MSNTASDREAWTVCNETDARLRVSLDEARDGEHWFELAPFERRPWTKGQRPQWPPRFEPRDEKAVDNDVRTEDQLLQRLQSHGCVRLLPKASTTGVNVEGLFPVVFGFGFAVVMTTKQIVPQAAASEIVAIVVGLVTVIAVVGTMCWKLGWYGTLRTLAQLAALLLTLAIGIGLPFFVIYRYGQGSTLWETSSLEGYGRLGQGAFIAVAALFPALLYYLFDRFRLGTLRAEFERHALRFDPQVRWLADVRSKYGARLDETYGTEVGTDVSRQGSGTRWPVQLGTLVVTGGWLAVLAPVGAPPPAATAADLLAYLRPQAALPAYGFLGAYFFAVFAMSRRYTRGDLQPKTYSHVVARMLIVTIAAWVLDEAIPDEGEWRTVALVVTFIVGVLPNTFYTVLGEIIRLKVLVRALASLEEKSPLTNIEGIDLYDRTRLAEEGVTNVQGLAHHDVIDLMLATRIPVPRLVDWLDQAILWLHASPATDDAPAEEAAAPAVGAGLHAELRRHGVRTATSFLRLREQVDELRADTAPAAATLPWPRLRMLEEALKHDEWLPCVQHWHQRRPALRHFVLDSGSGAVRELPPEYGAA